MLVYPHTVGFAADYLSNNKSFYYNPEKSSNGEPVRKKSKKVSAMKLGCCNSETERQCSKMGRYTSGVEQSLIMFITLIKGVHCPQHLVEPASYRLRFMLIKKTIVELE